MTSTSSLKHPSHYKKVSGSEGERAREIKRCSRIMIKSSMDATKDDDQVVLPGFRFHPTDEELVSFYLQRKIEKKLISIEFIKQIDIYKYEPWDLASTLFHTQFDFCLLLIFMIVFYLLRFSFN